MGIRTTRQCDTGNCLHHECRTQRSRSVDPRNNAAPHQRCIPVPIGVILLLALLLVPSLTVDEQNAKVDEEEIGEYDTPATHLGRLHSLLLHIASGGIDSLQNDVSRNARRETVRPRHDPVTEVVDMARAAPPAGRDQLGASSRLDVFEVLHAGVVGVRAETVLLVVGTAEDVVADAGDTQHAHETVETELERKDGEVPGLDGVEERDPDEISESKHVPKPVHDDIHRCQESRFHVQSIQDVECLEDSDEDNRIRDVAICPVLVRRIGEVKDYPAYQARPHFTEHPDINRPRSLADKGNGKLHAWVELTADKEVIENVSRVTARSQLAELRVRLPRCRD